MVFSAVNSLLSCFETIYNTLEIRAGHTQQEMQDRAQQVSFALTVSFVSSAYTTELQYIKIDG